MKYQFNLIRDIQEEQRELESQRKKTVWVITLCFIAMALSVLYGTHQILSMRRNVTQERDRLARIEAEFQSYKATEMIVNRADIQVLNELQRGRVFWSKKLKAMARHLAQEYWITNFGFDERSLNVEGYGYISPKQEQLITLHDYLNKLREDPEFQDVFKKVYLNSTQRDDDKSKRARVTFSYAGVKGGK